jgi:thermitase
MPIVPGRRCGSSKSTGKRIVAVWAASLVFITFFTALVGQTTSEQEYFVPGRILIKFVSGTSPGKALELVSQAQAQLGDRIDQIEVLELVVPPGWSEEQLAKHFKQFPEIEFAELDYLRPPAQTHSPAATPTDPYYSRQWHLAKASLPAAWNTTTGSSAIRIAILDTGVDGTHPDLSGKLLSGWNFYDNNSNTADVHGHGTAVAGTAAAVSNNGLGVASPAWDCLILPVRVSDPNGWAADSAIANALTWAADQGARVANISFAVSTSSAVRTAAQYFQSKGGVVTVSSGNEGQFISNADNPYVLTVGATDSADAVASWSNTGNIVDLVAPGISIYTTVAGGTYGYWSGTSFSAPLTAGVAALVLSANPSLSPAQVQGILEQSAADLGAAGWDASYGWGRLNAGAAIGYSAVQDTVPPAVSITNPVNGATVAGTVGVRVNATDDRAVASVTYSVNGTVLGVTTTAPFDFTWDTLKTAANGSRTLQAVASDSAGNTTSSSVTVTVSNADGSPPTVKFISPTAKAKVKGVVTVQVSATDDGMVNSVGLYVDSKLVQTLTKEPYNFTWDTNTATNASHTLMAKATDGWGNTASAFIAVTVTNPDLIPPAISITSPADGASITSSKLSVTHNATDNQKVSKVELYVDGQLKSQSTKAPFTISWTTIAGTHTLQSKAYDAANNSAWSQIVSVIK